VHFLIPRYRVLDPDVIGRKEYIRAAAFSAGQMQGIERAEAKLFDSRGMFKTVLLTQIARPARTIRRTCSIASASARTLSWV
jgi:hypothetical protein